MSAVVPTGRFYTLGSFDPKEAIKLVGEGARLKKLENVNLNFYN